MNDAGDNPGKADGIPAPGLPVFLLRAGALSALLAIALLAVLVLVPDGNDYAKAAGLKGERLASLPGPKIVMIGGSNLAFGVDSPLIERITGCPVANMGMNGYLGVRYMLAEAASGLKAGDVAVIALEYDSFVKSVEGTATDLLMIAKTNFGALAHLTPMQLARAASRVPLVVQAKVDRLADEAAQGLYDAAFARDASPAPVPAGRVSIAEIESFSGFTPEGDLVSHLDIEWPYNREDGFDLTTLPVDPVLLGLIRSFALDMKAIGVDVVFSYTPVVRYFHDRHAAAIENIDALVRRQLGDVMHIPSRPRDFVYETERFFDTVYHLNRSGREIRSRTLAQDIKSRQSTATGCRGANTGMNEGD